MTRCPDPRFVLLFVALVVVACSDPDDAPRAATEASGSTTSPANAELPDTSNPSETTATPTRPAANQADRSLGAQAPPDLPVGVAACVARLSAATPAELRTLLRDLDYTSAQEDACRSALAVQQGDAEACGELSTTALRRGCRVRVASRTGDADACPRDHRDERDPTCLAWADRTPSRCAAVSENAGSFEALRCRAVLLGEPARCREMGTLRAGCEYDVATISPWLTERRDRDLPPIEFEWTATVRTSGASVSSPAAVRFDVSRGARIVHEDCAAWLAFDAARLPVRATPGLTAAVQRLWIRVPERRRGAVDASGVRIRVATDDARLFDGASGEALVTGEANILQLASQRGGPVSVTLDAQVRLPTATLSLRGSARAFLRDVEPRESQCTGPSETEPRQADAPVNP